MPTSTFREVFNNLKGTEIEEFQKELSFHKRRLTDHITTRPYRAPEVILLEKHYHKSVDIWAVGIIIIELFKYLSTSADDKKKMQSNGKNNFQVFQASRCFPLTPKGVEWEDDGLPQTEGDLLDSVFELIGTPIDSDWKFISDNFAIDYIKKFTPREPKNLEAQFPKINAEGIKLLKQMLQFNPYLRPTAEECLQSPYFDNVRQFSKVKHAKKQVSLPIENKAEITLKEIREEFNEVINDFQMQFSSECRSRDNAELQDH